jgi:hypothetical protein
VFRWLLGNPFNFDPSDILEILLEVTDLIKKKIKSLGSFSPALTSHEPDPQPNPNRAAAVITRG